MDENMKKVTEEFITQRVSYYGQNETEALNEALTELRARVDCLRGTLTEEQARLLNDCENAYHSADGETARFYYKSGFYDAIRFLLHFGEEN